MVFFKKKRDDFVDLSEHYRKQKERADNMRDSASDSPIDMSSSSFDSASSESSSSESSSSGGMFGIFGGANVASTANNSSQESSGYADYSGNSNSESMDGMNERRKKLTKRILDMTQKLEDISNHLYRLQQRIEVLERKSGVGY